MRRRRAAPELPVLSEDGNSTWQRTVRSDRAEGITSRCDITTAGGAFGGHLVTCLPRAGSCVPTSLQPLRRNRQCRGLRSIPRRSAPNTSCTSAVQRQRSACPVAVTTQSRTGPPQQHVALSQGFDYTSVSSSLLWTCSPKPVAPADRDGAAHRGCTAPGARALLGCGKPCPRRQ